MLCSSVEVIFIEQRILRHLAKYPRRNRVLKMSLSVKQRAMIYYSFNRTRGFFFTSNSRRRPKWWDNLKVSAQKKRVMMWLDRR